MQAEDCGMVEEMNRLMKGVQGCGLVRIGRVWDARSGAAESSERREREWE